MIIAPSEMAKQMRTQEVEIGGRPLRLDRTTVELDSSLNLLLVSSLSHRSDILETGRTGGRARSKVAGIQNSWQKRAMVERASGCSFRGGLEGEGTIAPRHLSRCGRTMRCFRTALPTRLGEQTAEAG
jgi:hypothetical protein